MTRRNGLLRLLAVTALLVSTVPGPALAVERKTLPNKHDLKQLIATATTAEDHERLATYYRQEARRLEAATKEHQEMAEEYYRDPSRHPIPKYPTMGQHCRDLAGYYAQGATKAATLAALHEQLATDIAKSAGH